MRRNRGPRAAARADRARLHAYVLGARPCVLLRAAGVPRRQRARAGDRQGALRPLPGRVRGPAREDPLPRRLAPELRRGRTRAEDGERLAEAAGENLAGDELTRIVRSRNVTAALLEAAIAALFLEHGYGPIAPAIVAAFSDRIEYARTTHVDHKTELQEALAKSGRSVNYIVVDVEGPAHARHFSCAAQIDGEELGAGTGRTKKEAEQEAAKQALAAIGA